MKKKKKEFSSIIISLILFLSHENVILGQPKPLYLTKKIKNHIFCFSHVQPFFFFLVVLFLHKRNSFD